MHTFQTPGPVRLQLRTGGGSVAITATEEPVTTITLTPLNDAGADAVAQARVEQTGDRVLVDLPRRGSGLLRTGPKVAVDVAVPVGSRLQVHTDSAGTVAKGGFGDVQCLAGSGDIDVDQVDGQADVRTGSGAILLGAVRGHLRAKTGSGDVHVERTGTSAQIGLGSGDISLGEVTGEVSTKTGSGDLEVGVLNGDLTAKTGSGDLTVRRATSGRVRSSGASGDITIGVVEGTAAWLDLSTVTGRVSQELPATSGPAPGQAQVEVTAHTVSGDVRVYRP